MKWIRGEPFHPFEYRYFDGGGFPASLTFDHLTAELRTSFRVWLRFDQLVQTGKLTDRERLEAAFNLCFKSIDEGFPVEALKDGLVWFHGADRLDRSWLFDSPKRKNHKGLFEKMKAEAAKKNQSLNLLWDAGAIWGSFLSAFGIDLFRTDLHWWAFLALMNELPENCSVNRLIRQRSADLKEVNEKDRNEFVIRQHLASVPAGGILEGDIDNERQR